MEIIFEVTGVGNLDDIHENSCDCHPYRQQCMEPSSYRFSIETAGIADRDLLDQIRFLVFHSVRRYLKYPRKGVDGFKTEFHTANTTARIQIQISLKNEHVQACCYCSSNLIALGEGFCGNTIPSRQRYKAYVASVTMKNFESLPLSLEYLQTMNIILDEHPVLGEPPRCECYPENICRLHCEICNNFPVCVTCIHENHVNHEEKDEATLTRGVKDVLKTKIVVTNNRRRNILLTILQAFKKPAGILSICKEKKVVNQVLENLHYPDISEDEVSPVLIKGLNEGKISDLTNCGNGNIVITGPTTSRSSLCKSFIMLIDMEGGVLHSRKITSDVPFPVRFTAYLSDFKVATVCQLNEIGVYDLHDGSYKRRNISDITNSWPANGYVCCIATDVTDNHILVAAMFKRGVYVFDDQLNYCFKISLPRVIKYVSDMTFSEGCLLVCDNQGGKACVVSMKGSKGKLIAELPKPESDRGTLKPQSVCTDSNGFIYIMWEKRRHQENVIAQYTLEGPQLLRVKQVDIGFGSRISTAKVGNIEKLFLSRVSFGGLHIFSLT